MRIALALLSIAYIAHGSSCPAGFDLVSRGECRGLYTTKKLYWDERAVNTAIEKCDEIGALPVIIHTPEQQDYWKAIGRIVIGLVCPKGYSSWVWTDETSVNYRPLRYDAALDKKCIGGCSWYIQENGYWDIVCSGDAYKSPIYCNYQLEQPKASGDGCDSFEDDKKDGTCYQVGKVAKNWPDAQKICRNFGGDLASIHSEKENSFVRRLAVSKGAVNGLFLGAADPDGSANFSWIDGTKWDYDNFYPGYPAAGSGNCLAMDTQSSKGQWTNVPCLSEQAVACQRKQHYTSPGCTSGPFLEGDIIYSPGFPVNASVPCDFILQVDVGMRVEVEILMLEANSCCDLLVISEGNTGGTVIASLTGEVDDKKYRTTASNVMRVSWQPQGGINVRGVMMTFRGV